jgi:hypothetical protein
VFLNQFGESLEAIEGREAVVATLLPEKANDVAEDFLLVKSMKDGELLLVGKCSDI